VPRDGWLREKVANMVEGGSRISDSDSAEEIERKNEDEDLGLDWRRKRGTEHPTVSERA